MNNSALARRQGGGAWRDGEMEADLKEVGDGG
jgi:hypothetical protein